MSDFFEAEDYEESHMEVMLTSEDGTEYIYWVQLENCPEDESEEDWAIEQARNWHNSNGLPIIPEDTEDEWYSEACEPFSRSASEFKFINI